MPQNEEENMKYHRKYSLLKRTIKKLVYENAALCDQVFQLQEKVIRSKEERNYLAKRLSQYVPLPDKTDSYTLAALHKQTTGLKKRETSADKGKPRLSRSSGSQKRKKVSSSSQQIDSSQQITPFPIRLGPLSIYSLGEIVSDKSAFYTEDVVFPVGYSSTRLYGSLLDPCTPCIYTCKILHTGKAPLFQITSEAVDDVFSDTDIDVVHSELLQRINMVVQVEVVSTRGRGAHFFGLTHPAVVALLSVLPAIKRCIGYKGKSFDISKDDGGAAVSFESLQRCIAFTKSQLESLQQQELLESTATLRDLLNS